MSTYDWSRFVTRINIHAPIEMIYNAWTTREGIESWFLRLGEYKQRNGLLRDDDENVWIGDTFKWLWHGYSDETVEYGEILDMNETDYLKFSFGTAGICTIRIKLEEGESIVELLQEEIPTDEKGMQYYHVGCKTSWTFYLANLKSILEGGIDLRNKNGKLQEMLNS